MKMVAKNSKCARLAVDLVAMCNFLVVYYLPVFVKINRGDRSRPYGVGRGEIR